MNEIITKKCNKCGEIKTIDLFPKSKEGKYGVRAICTICMNLYRRSRYAEFPEVAESKRESSRKWVDKNPDKKRACRRKNYHENVERVLSVNRKSRMKFVYGITIEEFDNMLTSQNNKCICGRDNGKIRLHVDHDHKTGKVRGLLCVRCNYALGLVEDIPERLELLAKYLRDNK